jgi:hypothetical protein
MAQNYGPTIVTDGLILNLDAADVNSYPGPTLVDVMVVGGGGGGGMDMGGGGGGGGVVYQQNYAVTPGTGITVTVGAGGWGAPCGGGCYRGDGAGPQPNDHQFTIPATSGGNSVFGSITAYGGGFGGSSYRGYTPGIVGSAGGSGGGSGGYNDNAGTFNGGAGVAGQGYRGGNSTQAYYSGGGGGAGGPGVDSPNRPDGGPGILIPEMSPFYFGGGGGGASYSLSTGGYGGIGGGGGGALGTTTGGAGFNNGSPGGGGGPNQWAQTPGGNAGANTGGGGGGGSHYNRTNQGGNGGSGIVIVRYQGPPGATGGTITSRNGYTYHTFTSSGTFTPGGNTTWYNTSNPSLNASLINGVTYSSSNKGVLVLDGTDDTIFAPSINQLGAIPNPTWEIWVKSSGLGPGKSIGGLICPDYGQISYITGGGDIVYYLYNTDAGFPGTYVIYLVSSGVNCFDNQWHHIVCTRGYGIGAYIYVDGVVRASSGGGGLWSGSTIWSGMNTQIGNNPNDVYYNLLGNIGLAKIYNKYLTATEVLQNYNATKGRFI